MRKIGGGGWKRERKEMRGDFLLKRETAIVATYLAAFCLCLFGYVYAYIIYIYEICVYFIPIKPAFQGTGTFRYVIDETRKYSVMACRRSNKIQRANGDSARTRYTIHKLYIYIYVFIYWYMLTKLNCSRRTP